jgi:hypothetical protein
MLSSFLKKLLFARQFFMTDGKIEVLGKRQVMLPADVIDIFTKSGKADAGAIKEAVKKDMTEYAKKVGGSSEGMLNNITYIFETFGLGRLEIVDLDNKNKRCIVRIHNPTLKGGTVTSSMLSGTFSFLFGKEVDAEERKSGPEMAEYTIE